MRLLLCRDEQYQNACNGISRDYNTLGLRRVLNYHIDGENEPVKSYIFLLNSLKDAQSRAKHTN